MESEEVLKRLKRIDAIVNGHFVYTSGRHGNTYINKDAVYPHVEFTSQLCKTIAKKFSDDSLYGIDTVVAPAVGGVILCTWTAYCCLLAKKYLPFMPKNRKMLINLFFAEAMVNSYQEEGY